VRPSSHLHARGSEEIWIAVPFANSAPVDLRLAAALKAAASLGSPIEAKNVCSAATPGDRERLMARLKSAKKRTGLFCLEDNMSLVLWRAFAKAGIDCPRQIGLLSGMGDIVAEQGISSIKIDYVHRPHGGRGSRRRPAPLRETRVAACARADDVAAE
jgi:DNA-binding LacI/PurR family transcriptional regulator